MSFANLFRIAFKALQRNKLRAFLTMLGVIIGVGAVIAMEAIGEGSSRSVHAQLASMGSNMLTVLPTSNAVGGLRLGSSVQTLTMADVDALRLNTQNLSAVSPAAGTRGQAISGALNWPTQLQGVAPEYLAIRSLSLRLGVPFTDADVHSFAKVCLLGQTVVDNLFARGENPIGSIIRFNKVPFRVIGVLAPKGQNAFGQDQDDIIVAPYTTVQKRITASIYFQYIYASARSEALTTAAAAELKRLLRTTHRLRTTDADDFTIRTQAELIKTMGSTSQLLATLLTAIAGISLVIGGIGIMNIMYVSVTERTKEIGLRMAIGAWGRDILWQFLTEAVLISLAGGLLGIGVGIGAALLVTRLLGWPTVVTEPSILLSFSVCVLTGVFFGYYPAQKAARLDPIQALRYE